MHLSSSILVRSLLLRFTNDLPCYGDPSCDVSNQDSKPVCTAMSGLSL